MELTLGRIGSSEDPLQLREKRCLDVRALGDLSGFPALRALSFSSCEVMLCSSMLGAVRHACLTSFFFSNAHPAPECAPVVLLLSQELRRLGRGSVVKSVCYCCHSFIGGVVADALKGAQGQAPCQKFRAALKACEV